MRTPSVALLLLSLSAAASAATITGQSVFEGGGFGDWIHSFTLGAPGVEITQIQINLNSNLFFDTSAAAPGFLLNQDIGTTSEGGTGFLGYSATGNALNGGTTVVLTFNAFTAGKAFSHHADVDENVTLQNCDALPLLQRPACVITNTVATVDGSLVSGAEFAGSTVVITLGGPALASPVQLTGTFTDAGGTFATATWTGNVDLVPEPGTFALAGMALIASAIAACRKR